MDIFILIGSFTIVCLMGMPVAYALGIACHPGRPVGRHPARSGDAEGRPAA